MSGKAKKSGDPACAIRDERVIIGATFGEGGSTRIDTKRFSFFLLLLLTSAVSWIAMP